MTPIAAFDFDGTLFAGDSMFHFPRFALGRFRFALRVPFTALRVALAAVSHSKAGRSLAMKEAFFSSMLGGESVERLRALSELFIDEVEMRLDPWHVERLEKHLREGHRLAVVTASPDLWLLPWARRRGLVLLGSRLEEKEGRLTGRLVGANVRDEEKVRRLRAEFPDLDAAVVVAYGNSSGDLAMLRVAKEAYFEGKPARVDERHVVQILSGSGDL